MDYWLPYLAVLMIAVFSFILGWLAAEENMKINIRQKQGKKK